MRTPLAAAKRELSEETRFESDDWTPLGGYVVDGNYGLRTEYIYLPRDARDLRSGEIVQLSTVAAIAVAALGAE